MSSPHIMYALTIKKQLLNEISQTTNAIQRLVRKVDHLSHGLPIDIHTLPEDFNSCDFSDWYSVRMAQFKRFTKLQDLIKEVNKHYDIMHQLYIDIYALHKHKPKSTLMNMFLGCTVQKSADKREIMLENFRLFQASAKRFVICMNELERHLAIQPNDELLLFI